MRTWWFYDDGLSAPVENPHPTPANSGTGSSNPSPSSGESYANLTSSIEVPKILPSGGQRWHDGAWPAVAEGKHEESDENCGGCIPWRGFREPRPDGAPIVINK